MNSPLRQQLMDELCLRGYSKHTVRAYVHAVRLIAKRFRRSPDEVSFDELRSLLLERCRANAAASTLNLTVSAWIFFYDHVLGRDVSKLKADLPRPKKDKRKPRAYSKEEVSQIIYESNLNLKHQTFLSTVYHGGLRVSEACQIQVNDILSSDSAILIRQGKGKKDRYTILPERLLDELRDYFRQQRPQKPWLFSSKRYPDRPITVGAGLKIFYHALEACSLPNRGGIHCLRHSFASHHLHDGMDIARLQQLLGHTSLSTTANYLHVLSDASTLSRSPLDDF